MTLLIMGLWALIIFAIAVARPRALAATAVVMSVFEGAALFKAGGLGVSPYYFTLMLIAVRCLSMRVTSRDWLARTPGARSGLGALVAFTAVALVGALALPRVFAGIQVMSPRLSEMGTAPLEFSNSNIGQSVYLLLNLALIWWAARQDDPEGVARSMANAVTTAGTVVVGVALYQLAAALTGLPFPEDILYSNEAYVMQTGTLVLDMPRISSTFTEPAGMSVFLVAFLAFLTSEGAASLGGAMSGAWRVVLLFGTVAVLLLSTSSTGYVGLAAVGAWRLGAVLVLPAFRGRLSMRTTALTVAGLLAVVIAIAASPDLRDLIDKMVFEKDQSASYDERAAANAHGWQLAQDTFGLGTGLGSNRASSMLPSLLSTAGVFGLATLGVTVLLLLRRPAEPELRGAHSALAAGLIGIIGAKLLSGPDLSTGAMWALMAALVTTHAVAPTAASAAFVPVDEPETPSPRRRRFVEASVVEPVVDPLGRAPGRAGA